MSTTLRSIGAAELALRIEARRGHGDFCALVIHEGSGDDVDDVASTVAEEIRALGDTGATGVRASGDIPAFTSVLAGTEGPAVVTGLEDWSEADWQHLDELRSRLQRNDRTLLVLSRAAFDRLTTCAPNLGSWVSSAWAYLPDADRLSPEDRERRLAALRAWSGLSDEEMLERRRDGTLPLDPGYSLWLILLERGDPL